MSEPNDNLQSDSKPRWQPLTSIQRRVIGVLVEKAKTTPDAYPLSLNAIKTGSNQKSNRSPQMELDEDDILIVLDELKAVGAVVEIQSGGRVSKFRHTMYDWLGVDKFELAVVTELLLRGQQTLGELRGRANRMESIADISALRPICDSLMQKKLMISVTPAGRGQIVDHGLYPENEAPVASPIPTTASPAAVAETRAASQPAVGPSDSLNKSDTADLLAEIERLKTSITAIEQRLADLESKTD